MGDFGMGGFGVGDEVEKLVGEAGRVERDAEIAAEKVEGLADGVEGDGIDEAERFIQSSIREWAYARMFQTSAERKTAMHLWLHDYNTARPHSALGGKPPISRLNRDNLP